MKNRNWLLWALLFFLGTAFPLSARPIEIRMGSVAPDNSIYSELLRELAAEWEEISDGEVKLKIYFSGFKDDSDVIRKIRINQLQAGVVTGFGLQDLYPNVLALSIPSLIQNDKELEYVLDKIRPVVQEELNKKRFELMAWSKAGWVYFFTREPVVYPGDLEGQKIASLGTGAAGEMLNAFKHIGFHPVSVPSNETLTSLVSGMADAVYATPIAVAAGQWFGITKHMTDMRISPFVGGIVFSRRAWQRVPSDLRPRLEEAVQRIAGELDRELAALEEEAIGEMKKRGLKSHDVPAEAQELWDRRFTRAVEWASGNVYDKKFVEMVEEHLEEYRQSR
ncbi:MAG: TRAP transporter substrate-binding protein DctP [Spirochaetaceae bacterium]